MVQPREESAVFATVRWSDFCEVRYAIKDRHKFIRPLSLTHPLTVSHSLTRSLLCLSLSHTHTHSHTVSRSLPSLTYYLRAWSVYLEPTLLSRSKGATSGIWQTLYFLWFSHTPSFWPSHTPPFYISHLPPHALSILLHTSSLTLSLSILLHISSLSLSHNSFHHLIC